MEMIVVYNFYRAWENSKILVKIKSFEFKSQVKTWDLNAKSWRKQDSKISDKYEPLSRNEHRENMFNVANQAVQ